MKHRLALIALLFIFLSNIAAQAPQSYSSSITWKGIEKWYADTLYSSFISFEGASFPAENRLPYFSKKIECDSAAFYSTRINNPKFIPVTPEEAALINISDIPGEIQVQSRAIHEDGKNFIRMQLLPFINRNGQILKLLSFDAEVYKKTNIQKAAQATVKKTYTESSVLAQGKFVKIRIVNSGVYKLTYEELNSMGVNPANVRVFGYGGAVLEQNMALPKKDDLPEVAIWMEKGTDGVFNAGDYILFYGQGVVKWSYNKSLSMYTHAVNPYSKYGYYFVTSDAGTGKRIEDKTIDIPANASLYPVEEFTDYQVHEIDNQHLIESGKEFYGEVFGEKTSYSFTFGFPNVVSTSSTKTRLDVVNAAFNSASFTLSLNGGQSQYLPVAARNQNDNYEQGKAASGIYTFKPDNDNLTFNIGYNKPNASATGYLNYLEVNARRQLKMSGSVMAFQNLDRLDTDLYNQFSLSNAGSNIQIWDITEQDNISKITTQTSGGKLIFKAPAQTEKRYLAIDPSAKTEFPSPVVEGVVTNQNLHSIKQADFVIITHPSFLAQAEKLAHAHREKDQLNVEVVTTEQVYNEFSSGAPDATAYRWIMRMLYDRASATAARPKYLLLFGKGSFDNKRIFSNSAHNYILTYQAENSLVTTLSYVTDDYFGMLADDQGIYLSSDSLMIGVGRLPVATTQQATDVVNKLIGYMENTDKTSWKNQLCFLADDGDGNLHMSQANGIADAVSKKNPAFQVNKIFLDAYQQEISASGETYPVAKNRFSNLLRSGLFYLNYTGHAGPTGWTNEAMLSLSDIKKLSNKQLPFVMAATCDFLEFDKQETSGGEQMLLNQVGGCIGILSATRPVYASPNEGLNKLVADNFFKKENGQHLRLGDIVSAAKNGIGSEFNKLSYVLMGDPAMKLHYPTKYKIVTESINHNSSLAGKDTLRALSVSTINGYIADENGNKLTNFNGNVYTVVYDKVQTIVTMNNDKSSSGPFTYTDRPNILFSGKSTVTNGTFSVSFMLPKDIKYNYGNGRISYYAADDTNDYEAQGNFENFLIGGSNTSYTHEENGPEVKAYLNAANFVSGDIVNETPLFIAEVSDVNGVNTVGSGIGHDILLTIDQDPAQSYILNDFFQAAEGDYKSGTIRYKLPELSEGKHTFTFRVFDLLNNSSNLTANFEVKKGLTPTIFSVNCFPNPVKASKSTSIKVDHDRPETILKTTVEIFDLSGRKIWSFSQSSADAINWDMSTADGQKVKTGIYLYRVSIKTANSDSYSKTNKILVTE